MSDNELVDAIRKQAEAAEGNDSFASLATWIGDRLTEQEPGPVEADQESPAGATTDRTNSVGAGPDPAADPLAAVKDLFARAIADQGNTNLFDDTVYPE